MRIRDGELNDAEMRRALKEYLAEYYNLKSVDELTLECVREAVPLVSPAEYRVRFRGEVDRQDDVPGPFGQ